MLTVSMAESKIAAATPASLPNMPHDWHNFSVTVEEQDKGKELFSVP